MIFVHYRPEEIFTLLFVMDVEIYTSISLIFFPSLFVRCSQYHILLIIHSK